MGDKTGISWTNRTWNPWRGCTKVSPGCKNCYMFSEQSRYGQDPSAVLRTKTWGDPVKWNKKAALTGLDDLVFTCSWSDWFHEAADPWRPEAWEVIRNCPNLSFQILTKRPERIAAHLPSGWPFKNVWLGVSVENQEMAQRRIPILGDVEAEVKFLSCEPLLGPLLFSVERIDWVILGGESGPGARPCNAVWILDLVEQLKERGVPCFVKQLGSNPYWLADGMNEPDYPKFKDRKGADPSEWPDRLRVQQFPT